MEPHCHHGAVGRKGGFDGVDAFHPEDGIPRQRDLPLLRTREPSGWGYVDTPEATVAVYYVHWTLDRVMEHGAHFDLIMGFWGEAARDEDRLSVSLEYHIVDGIPSFMVIDARPRPFAQAAIAGRALDRSEVIGTDMAGFAFRMVDAIALGDDRLAELFPGLCEAEASHQVQ